MRKTFASIAIILVAVTAAYFLLPYERASAPTAVVKEDKEEVLSYFTASLTDEVKRNEGYEKLGLTDGADAFVLVKAYPHLEKRSFRNVVAYQGEYSIVNGELMFTGHAASNSAVLKREGMRTLLENISKDLSVPVESKRDIDALLLKLKNGQ